MHSEHGDQMSFWKKVAQYIFVQIVEKSSPKMWVTSLCNFQKTAQIKLSPIRRKFAQSGHPDSEPSVRQSAKWLLYYWIGGAAFEN
jgi:hypothetical protein